MSELLGSETPLGYSWWYPRGFIYDVAIDTFTFWIKNPRIPPEHKFHWNRSYKNSYNIFLSENLLLKGPRNYPLI